MVTNKGILVPLFGAPAPVDNNSVCLLNTTCIDDTITVPECGAAKAKVLMHATGAVFRQIDARGGNPLSFNVNGGLDGKLDNAGCVDVVTPNGTTVGQFATVFAGVPGTTAYDFTVSTTHLVECTDGSCAPTAELARGAAVGFERVSVKAPSGTPHRIITTTVDATGVVLVRGKLTPSSLVIEEPPRMPAAALPDHVITGSFDQDPAGFSTLWDISPGRAGASFEIAYHHTIGSTGLPVEALSALQLITVAQMLVEDFDGDHFDDIVIATTKGIAVIPTSAPLPSPGMNPDLTCPP